MTNTFLRIMTDLICGPLDSIHLKRSGIQQDGFHKTESDHHQKMIIVHDIKRDQGSIFSIFVNNHTIISMKGPCDCRLARYIRRRDVRLKILEISLKFK